MLGNYVLGCMTFMILFVNFDDNSRRKHCRKHLLKFPVEGSVGSVDIHITLRMKCRRNINLNYLFHCNLQGWWPAEIFKILNRNSVQICHWLLTQISCWYATHSYKCACFLEVKQTFFLLSTEDSYPFSCEFICIQYHLHHFLTVFLSIHHFLFPSSRIKSTNVVKEICRCC